MPSASLPPTVSSQKPKLVVDNVHGDIRLTTQEWRIVDTASFQRLRSLKQLQMGHLVYPNATHTRFAHSVGVRAIMERILNRVKIKQAAKPKLLLAALLHDIGHYPYSHLMENVDRVVLTEESLKAGAVGEKVDLHQSESAYPDHEELGREIVSKQPDLLGAIGSQELASEVGHLFSRTKIADQQLSKLIHSSLDMDRMDYLIRDSRAAGVPYGNIDINYLLNQVRMSRSGMLGIEHKALAAAEHLLLARSFVFRVVCQHKTTYGLEEAARQLLCRIRKKGLYKLPTKRKDILGLVTSKQLPTFTDAYLDQIFIQASTHTDAVIKSLARSITSRRPPRLLKEIRAFSKKDEKYGQGALFLRDCKQGLQSLAASSGVPAGQFLICELPSIGFEARGPNVAAAEALKMKEEGAEEMIKVFWPEEAKEPTDIVDVPHSMFHVIGDYVFRTYRLYVAYPEDDQDEVVAQLRQKVAHWGKDS